MVTSPQIILIFIFTAVDCQLMLVIIVRTFRHLWSWNGSLKALQLWFVPCSSTALFPCLVSLHFPYLHGILMCFFPVFVALHPHTLEPLPLCQYLRVLLPYCPPPLLLM